MQFVIKIIFYTFVLIALRKENEKIKVIQNDIDATKKEAQKHMEQNESLEQFKQRLEEDLNHLNKQCKFEHPCEKTMTG